MCAGIPAISAIPLYPRRPPKAPRTHPAANRSPAGRAQPLPEKSAGDNLGQLEIKLFVDRRKSKDLIHDARRFGASRVADNSRWDARHRLVVRQRMRHNRTSGNARATANLRIAEN